MDDKKQNGDIFSSIIAPNGRKHRIPHCRQTVILVSLRKQFRFHHACPVRQREELKWGPQASAIPALVKLLETADENVRVQAAEVMCQWGHKVRALPALVKMLDASDAKVHVRAARVVMQWGSQTNALLALVWLLEETDTFVRGLAAEMLDQRGPHATMLPALLKLLVSICKD